MVSLVLRKLFFSVYIRRRFYDVRNAHRTLYEPCVRNQSIFEVKVKDRDPRMHITTHEDG